MFNHSQQYPKDDKIFAKYFDQKLGESMSQATICSLGKYLPERVLTNADLEKMVDTSNEWIVTRTGIQERRLANEQELPSFMGARAAEEALQRAGVSADVVDLIVVVTSTPDYLFPSTASLIQAEIGANRAAAFDMQAACTGFVYGLSLVKAYLESGIYQTVLLVATERLSSFVDYTDRRTCILFGDGAAAALITNEATSGLSIESLHLGSDGKGADLLCLPAGGARGALARCKGETPSPYLDMSGSEIFKHGVRRMTESALQCLSKQKIAVEEISYCVPHQANLRMIESVSKRLGLGMEQFYLTIAKYGNTSASSIPLALQELVERELTPEDEYILLTSIGAGLTYGSCLLRNRK